MTSAILDLIGQTAAKDRKPAQVEAEINSLLTEYQNLIENDWNYTVINLTTHLRKATLEETKEAVMTELQDNLVREIGSNRSRWSGGHSATNMCEQIKRDVAIEFLASGTRQWRVIGLIEKAYKELPADTQGTAA